MLEIYFLGGREILASDNWKAVSTNMGFVYGTLK